MGGECRSIGGCDVSAGNAAGTMEETMEGKVSLPMSSVMSESVDLVVIGLVEVRSDVGQGSPAMKASRLSPMSEI